MQENSGVAEATRPAGTPIDREKLLGIGFLPRGRSGSRVREGRRADGVRVKATTDELGNTTTEHATRDDRVDVQIRAPHVRLTAQAEEIRT